MKICSVCNNLGDLCVCQKKTKIKYYVPIFSPEAYIGKNIDEVIDDESEYQFKEDKYKNIDVVEMYIDEIRKEIVMINPGVSEDVCNGHILGAMALMINQAFFKFPGLKSYIADIYLDLED